MTAVARVEGSLSKGGLNGELDCCSSRRANLEREFDEHNVMRSVAGVPKLSFDI